MEGGVGGGKQGRDGGKKHRKSERNRNKMWLQEKIETQEQRG